MQREKRRETLLRLIEATEQMMTETNCNSKTRQDINVLKEDMKDDFFTVVVVGEFKRGKSTFVNALLGEDLLIADVLPETATIQAIMYSAEKKAQVLYQDGSTQNGVASKEFLKTFSAKTQENTTGVKYIKIGYPLDFISKKVVLVDTPGVSDMDEQRVQVTYDFLPKANVVLFVLDAVSPLKKTEKEFIEEHLFQQGISKVIFILNKMDLFDEEEESLEEYLENVRFRIGSAFADSKQIPDIQILPVSAWMAVEGIRQKNSEMIEKSNIETVKKKLQEIIIKGDIEQLQLDGYKNRFVNIVKDWKVQTEREICFYEMNEQQLQNQLVSIQTIQSNFDSRYALIDTYVDREKEFLFSMLAKSVDKFHKDLLADIDYEVERYMGTGFKEFMERDIPHLIKKRTELWMQTHFSGIDKVLTQLEEKLSLALSRYFNRKVFISSVSEELWINPQIQMTARDISSATISAGVVTATGTIALSLLGASMFTPLVSMAVFPMLREKFLKDSLKESKEEVLPQLHEEIQRFIWDLQESIQKNIENRIRDITFCVQDNYQRFITGYKKNMQMCLEDKQKNEEELVGRKTVKQENVKKLESIIDAISKL